MVAIEAASLIAAILIKWNIGTGTANPERKLHIKDNDPEIRLEEADKANKKWHIDAVNSGLTIAETGTGDWLYVKPGGNVGVRTTNPAEKLDVEGNIDVSSNQIRNY